MFRIDGICRDRLIHADEFTKADLQRFLGTIHSYCGQGRELWTSPKLGSNGVALCPVSSLMLQIPIPETYTPKFQKPI